MKAGILSNRWVSTNNVGSGIYHSEHSLSLPALSKVQYKESYSIFTLHSHWTSPCADISWKNTVIHFATENLDDCTFKMQTSWISCKLRRNVYPPTFDIWNTSGLPRCNTLYFTWPYLFSCLSMKGNQAGKT